jgi:hypothetical protein
MQAASEEARRVLKLTRHCVKEHQEDLTKTKKDLTLPGLHTIDAGKSATQTRHMR